MKQKTLSALLHKLEEATSETDQNIVSLNEALTRNMKKGGYGTNNGHCHSGYNSSCGNSHCSGTSNGSCSNSSCLI